MSSNPFRRSAHLTSPNNKVTLVTNTTLHNDAFHERKTSKSNKQVRIITPPPLSPDSSNEESLSRQISYEGRTPSPPPEAAPAREYFDASGAYSMSSTGQTFDTNIVLLDQEVIDNTRKNSDANHAGPYRPVGEIVANPFMRTSAQESQLRYPISKPEWRVPEADSLTAARIDVDSFKHMLLTGSSPPNILNNEAGWLKSDQDFADTSTTASSMYSQLQSEPASDRVSLSLDTSHETSDEGVLRLRPKKRGPPPPAPRRVKGSDLGAKQWQSTASDDFEQADANSLSKISRKSLPPTPSGSNINPHNYNEVNLIEIAPMSHKHELLRNPVNSQATRHKTTDLLEETQEKKTGPTPPLSRRSSQIRPSLQNWARGESNPLTSEADIEDHIQPSLSSTSSGYLRSLPPVPDSRHHATNANRSGGFGDSNQLSDDFNPPSRANVPPPPPPRRRGSSRSSIDHQTIVVQETSLPPASVVEKDVLADLRKLQAEVDALRDRYRHTS